MFGPPVGGAARLQVKQPDFTTPGLAQTGSDRQEDRPRGGGAAGGGGWWSLPVSFQTTYCISCSQRSAHGTFGFSSFYNL